MSLDASEIVRSLGDCPVTWELIVHDEIASTSDVAREAGLGGAPHGTAIFAEHQTAGRGRRHNRWLMERGAGLMFSLVLRPAAPMALWPRLTTLAALAVCKGIEAELPLRPLIKWPNDIYLSDRKAAGLLAESFTGPHGPFLVLGIGVNVNTRAFPEAIRDSATSLLLEVRPAPPALDRCALAAALLRALGIEIERLDEHFPDAMSEVRARSWLIGKAIRAKVDGREIFGRAADLNHEGHLLIALPDGTLRALSSADEVRWVV